MQNLGQAINRGVHVMVDQRNKGIAKYGQPIEDAPVTVEQLIRHAQEEMADGLVYTSQLHDAFEARLIEDRTNLIADVLTILSTGANMDIKEAQISSLVLIPPVWSVLYAQPSQFDVFRCDRNNLLQLSRSKVFPFTQAVMVRA